MTRLLENAYPGDTILFVAPNLQYYPGDLIGLPATNADPMQSETVVVESYED